MLLQIVHLDVRTAKTGMTTQNAVPHPARNRQTAEAAAPRMCCSSYIDFVDHRCVEESYGSFLQMQKSQRKSFTN